MFLLLLRSEINRVEVMHWIGYWMSFYLLCIEPATYDFLTYWWLPFRQTFKGLTLLWLMIPRDSRPPRRPLPSPSQAVAEGWKVAEETREKWVTKIVEDGKRHYANIVAATTGDGGGGSSQETKPGIKGWESLGYAFMTSCFFLIIETYH